MLHTYDNPIQVPRQSFEISSDVLSKMKSKIIHIRISVKKNIFLFLRKFFYFKTQIGSWISMRGTLLKSITDEDIYNRKIPYYDLNS